MLQFVDAWTLRHGSQTDFTVRCSGNHSPVTPVAAVGVVQVIEIRDISYAGQVETFEVNTGQFVIHEADRKESLNLLLSLFTGV